MLNIIVACDNNYLIGVNGKLPWHIPADLKRFKELTTGHAVIMGRNTWEGLPIKPLPNRQNIILSNTSTYGTIPFDEVDVASNLGDAIHYFAEYKRKRTEIFVIGGARLYAEALPIADRIYMTRIDREYRVDQGIGDEAVYFPFRLFDKKDWEISSIEIHPSLDDVHPSIAFQIYDRRKSNGSV